jgi:hypothetical protein
MNKQIEKFKKQLLEITDVVNAFNSEQVQVKIIEKFLNIIVEGDRGESYDHSNNIGLNTYSKRSRSSEEMFHGGTRQAARIERKPGATKILHQLLLTDFFDDPRSISDITTHCKISYQANFQTSELSGILLKLIKENKLERRRNSQSNRFEYVKASQEA